ncbi:hypothetical protein RB595_008194 [Gaeumannomyces hyphopodioides]
MEEFLIANRDRFEALVRGFKAKDEGLAAKKSNGRTTATDIVVVARVRPVLDEEKDTGALTAVLPRPGLPGTIDCHEIRKTIRGQPALDTSTFKVDRAFGPEDTTDAIYSSVVQQLVPWAWSGGVGTLFAYGQTSSGKTFTVSGLERLVARSLFDGGSGCVADGERRIYASIVELAGNSALDLLNARRPVSVLTDSFGETQVAGALERRVESSDELLALVDVAAALRATAPTLRNDASSRSHAVCRIRIELPTAAGGGGGGGAGAEDGLLYLVDLAGSEAARDVSEHGADRMREAREINASLSTLKDCIRGRVLHDAAAIDGGKKPAAAGGKQYVPFRQSTLTKMLRHVFDPESGRSCRTVVVACVNPGAADTGASKNTLRYAEMLRVVVPSRGPRPYDPRVPATWNNAQLREWIQSSSGSPAVDAETLAPSETGPQLLRLPIPEFLRRCLLTPGVSPEQARAFQSKYWQLHVDSWRAPASQQPQSSTPAGVDGLGDGADGSSSRTVRLRGSLGALPFQERIRPGMVVRWEPETESKLKVPGHQNLALVLCPQSALGPGVRDALGNEVSPAAGGGGDAGESGKSHGYLCALVLPGMMPGSYEVNIWRQGVVPVDKMEAEVILEYDPATRYYYMSV